jgi:hypothetical protein
VVYFATLSDLKHISSNGRRTGEFERINQVYTPDIFLEERNTTERIGIAGVSPEI